MKSSLLISLLVVSSLGWTQEPTYIFEDTINDKNIVRFSSYNTYSSNRFSNEFMDKFLFGGDITQELKDKTSKKLKALNSIGGEAEQRIDSYSPNINLFGKEEYGLKLSFSDNHYFGSHISTDLFNTVMYGNADYIGDTMAFTFSNVKYQHYQKFGVGFYHQHNMSSIQINYIAGSKAIDGRLTETWMHSRADLDTIDVVLAGSGFTTESFSPYLAFQGSGFAIDVDYNFLFKGQGKNTQIINFRINNLGMIVWNKRTKNYFVNSSNKYSGFDVQDIIDQDTSVDNSIDWMDTLGITEDSYKRIDVLPLELVVQKVADRSLDQKLQAIFGFKTVLVPDYFPYLYAGVYYKVTDEFSLSSRLSYGGFAGIRWGLNVNYWLKDKMYFTLGSFDLIGLASKKFRYGRGVNLSLYYKI